MSLEQGLRLGIVERLELRARLAADVGLRSLQPGAADGRAPDWLRLIVVSNEPLDCGVLDPALEVDHASPGVLLRGELARRAVTRELLSVGRRAGDARGFPARAVDSTIPRYPHLRLARAAPWGRRDGCSSVVASGD